MVRAIIFDLWDTLVQGNSLTGALRERFEDVTPDIVSVCEQATMLSRHDLAEMAEALLDAIDQPITEDNLKFVKQTFIEARNSAQIIPGITELLSTLKERYTLVILSNNTTFSSDTVTTLGLKPYFSHEIYSWQIEALKPNAEAFLLACEKLSLHPEECILIDNNQDNVAGAEDVGMGAVLFTDAATTEQELIRMGIL